MNKNTKYVEIKGDAKNKSFFSLFFASKNSVKIWGYGGQVLSGLTTGLAVYLMVGGSMDLQLETKNVLACLFALFVIYIFEVQGVRTYLVATVRQLVKKDFATWQHKTLFAANLVLTLLICGANIGTSIVGQKSTLKDKTEIKTVSHTSKIDSTLLSEKRRIATLYETKKDKATESHNKAVKSLNTGLYVARKDKVKRQSINDDLIAATAAHTQLMIKYDSLSNADYLETKELLTSQKNTFVNESKSDSEFWLFVSSYSVTILLILICISWTAIIYEEIYYTGSKIDIDIVEKRKHKIQLFIAFCKGVYDRFYHVFYRVIKFVVGENKYMYNDLQSNSIEFGDKANDSKHVSSNGIDKANYSEYPFNSPNLDNKKNTIGFNKEICKCGNFVENCGKCGTDRQDFTSNRVTQIYTNSHNDYIGYKGKLYNVSTVQGWANVYNERAMAAKDKGKIKQYENNKSTSLFFQNLVNRVK